tara:strand:+ start:223 stop:465 length:243 start_codon:yes stop_codon:yes gene_type:complete
MYRRKPRPPARGFSGVNFRREKMIGIKDYEKSFAVVRGADLNDPHAPYKILFKGSEKDCEGYIECELSLAEFPSTDFSSH